MPLRTPWRRRRAAAFKYAKNNGARVVNYSAGSNQASASERAAIDGASNMLFVVSAGNERINVDADPIYPCAWPSANVICVTSTDQHDRLSSFSNIGPASVDIAAPAKTSSAPIRPVAYRLCCATHSARCR